MIILYILSILLSLYFYVIHSDIVFNGISQFYSLFNITLYPFFYCIPYKVHYMPPISFYIKFYKFLILKCGSFSYYMNLRIHDLQGVTIKRTIFIYKLYSY